MHSIQQKYAQKLLDERDMLLSLLESIGGPQSVYFINAAHAAKAELEQAQMHLNYAKEQYSHFIGPVIDAEFSLYEYEHPAQTSTQLASELKMIRDQVKVLVCEKQAATALNSFFFDGSEAKGRSFVEKMKKLMLRAYNAEVENAIKSVKSTRSSAAVKKIERCREQTEKLGDMIQLKISNHYHELRIREVELAFEHFRVLENERERARKGA